MTKLVIDLCEKDLVVNKQIGQSLQNIRAPFFKHIIRYFGLKKIVTEKLI